MFFAICIIILEESHAGDHVAQQLCLISVPVLLMLRYMVCAAKH